MTTRRPLIAGNWKMNLSLDEATSLAHGIGQSAHSRADVAVIPPFPWLVPVKYALGDAPVLVGAQNCHWERSGAFTGEVSPAMLAGLCDFVLAGHSERRHVFGEGNEAVGRKARAIVDAGMQVVLCVGETIDERRADQALPVVERQLATGLNGFTDGDASFLVIAYEPVWAIGTGVAATTGDAQEMCKAIRDWLSNRFGEPGASVRVLYGGSMSPANAAELLAQPDIDGGLVGGASLKLESFLAIVEAAEAVATS